VLILDEPDAHLHPDNQRRIIRMIIELAEKKDFQLILSTHSRHMIDEISEEAKIFWIKDGNNVEEDEFDIVRILLELGALDKGDLLKQGKIKSVILTEDSTDIEMMKVLLESSGFKIDEIDIWSYNGCTKIDSAILLSAFIQKHAPCTKIIIHRDRDYLYEHEVEEYCRKIEVGGRKCFITKGTDVESYYINAAHINFIYDSINIERCQEIIDYSIEEKRDSIIEKFINSRTMLELQASRKNADGKINNGEISIKCIKLYEEDINRYKHGKLVLRALKNNLQKKIGGNINLIRPSEFICDEDLKKIAKEIWES
jgi:energy-coupling factor transporter ATP-binding protein EcfA2